MIRLTDAQIAEARRVADEVAFRFSVDTEKWDTAFAHRIAALAVQEVEREGGFVNVANLNRIATLTAQLAEVTKERDDAKAKVFFTLEANTNLLRNVNALAEERNELAADLRELRAQLATAKREGWYEVAQYIQGQSHHPHPTDFGVATAIRAEAENRYPYPATPSGDGVKHETTCALCGYGEGHAYWCKCATPSPEAREVDSEFLLRVVQEVNAYAVITPADAKRIVRLAQEAE